MLKQSPAGSLTWQTWTLELLDWLWQVGAFWGKVEASQFGELKAMAVYQSGQKTSISLTMTWPCRYVPAIVILQDVSIEIHSSFNYLWKAAVHGWCSTCHSRCDMWVGLFARENLMPLGHIYWIRSWILTILGDLYTHRSLRSTCRSTWWVPAGVWPGDVDKFQYA